MLENELEMNYRNLVDTIKKQNKIETDNESFHMHLLKRIKSINKEEMNHPDRTTKEEGSIIMELDEETYDWMPSIIGKKKD